MTRFTIIIPFHSDADTIADTLTSIRTQSFPNWEAICVGDRPSKACLSVVLDHIAQDPRIRVAGSPLDGPSAARNYGAELAKGDILAFCDADDLWHKYKLAQLNEAFQPASTDAVFGQIRFFADQPGDSQTCSTVPDAPLTIQDLLAENPVCTMSNLSIRREVFNAIGGLDARTVHNEDLELLIRLAGEGFTIKGVDRFQVWYRTNAGGLSSNLNAMRAGRAYAVKTAASYGVFPSRSSEAVYLRYLARRALRLGHQSQALSYTRNGLGLHARSFLLPLRRGLPTAAGATLAPILPQVIKRTLFS
ncbi:glycosyltransferase family A protein [Ruegeria sp. HKCCA4008]|jgi:glycosyltransferase involved in cell wall biosynthesis|uniref:glycosyltransferase family 2 protein n=1 Tax=Ruegeria sp. HKCCA4008 TaxID=2682999 RepID=UPI00148845DA|nr:glycosyltransferase family A protein [Ruegeria sp. HKCCA4008]